MNISKTERTKYREGAYEQFKADLKSSDQRVRAAATAIQARIHKVTYDAEMTKNVIAALAMLDGNGGIKSLDHAEKTFQYWNAQDTYAVFAPTFANYLVKQMMGITAQLNSYGN
ncbi:MAG: hypothetical protein JRN68_03190 [Nitrososphaerota archaeon]|nr:hypothetical protein [Nitrososphaerota archaeon]